MKSWHDVKTFVVVHGLQLQVIRFNMSPRGRLIDLATGATLANTVKDAAAYLIGNAA